MTFLRLVSSVRLLRRAFVLPLFALPLLALPACSSSENDTARRDGDGKLCPSPPASSGHPAAGGAANTWRCVSATSCVFAQGVGVSFAGDSPLVAACAAEGGVMDPGRGCAPATDGGCCIRLAEDGLAEVQTCLFETDTDDPASTQASCEANCGTWSTVDATGENHDTPDAPATFVSGCDFPGRATCVLYDTPTKGVECKEGSSVTSCPTDGLLGCCRIKGPILECSYASSGLTSADVEASCTEDGGVFWQTQAGPAN